jgi:glycosyltransferase involved in cell wall biosynthesis
MNVFSSHAETNSMHAASPAPIGVIVPTYNRPDALLLCLQHLERQTCNGAPWLEFEVIVIDDGSTDHTPELVRSYLPRAPFRMSYFRQPNSGPARARNQAIQMLTAPIGILIGDDIFPEPAFVAAHLRFHQANPALQHVAVGLTRWDTTRQQVTPFMRWLDSDGFQFSYGDLLAGTPATWEHFYTSNLSFKTAYLRDNPFHEGFRKAAVEDIELGHRLHQHQGLAMSFLPEAIAEHLHPTTFLQACRRMVGVGESAYVASTLSTHFQRSLHKPLWERLLLALLTEPNIALPVLAHSVNLLQRFWCPNPLLAPVLKLHERYGFLRARRLARATGTAPIQSAG